MSEVLESNFIDSDAYCCALDDNYEGFIDARNKLIVKKAKELCDDIDNDIVQDYDMNTNSNIIEDGNDKEQLILDI